MYVSTFLNSGSAAFLREQTGASYLICVRRDRRKEGGKVGGRRKQSGDSVGHCLKAFLDLLLYRCVTVDTLRSRERALRSLPVASG